MTKRQELIGDLTTVGDGDTKIFQKILNYSRRFIQVSFSVINCFYCPLPNLFFLIIFRPLYFSIISNCPTRPFYLVHDAVLLGYNIFFYYYIIYLFFCPFLILIKNFKFVCHFLFSNLKRIWPWKIIIVPWKLKWSLTNLAYEHREFDQFRLSKVKILKIENSSRFVCWYIFFGSTNPKMRLQPNPTVSLRLKIFDVCNWY